MYVFFNISTMYAYLKSHMFALMYTYIKELKTQKTKYALPQVLTIHSSLFQNFHFCTKFSILHSINQPKVITNFIRALSVSRKKIYLLFSV